MEIEILAFILGMVVMNFIHGKSKRRLLAQCKQLEEAKSEILNENKRLKRMQRKLLLWTEYLEESVESLERIIKFSQNQE